MHMQNSYKKNPDLSVSYNIYTFIFLCEVDIENGLEDMGGRGKLGQSESSIDIYTLPNVK